MNHTMFKKMVSIVIAAFLFTAVFSTAVHPVVYGEAVTNPSDKTAGIVKLIEDEVKKLVDEKSVKGAVASVVKADQVLLSQGYGYVDDHPKVEADKENTAFRIGSVSKTFVALAAMQLVERGMLDMNAPISQYLGADFPAFRHTITMKHLLTHTAGFEEMGEGLGISQDEEAKPLGEVVRKYIPGQVFNPEEVISYSNYGISLAAYIIEKITDKPFYDYAEENIFMPLGMVHTSFKQKSYKASVVSKGFDKNGLEKTESLINLYPAGSVSSTAEDMSKYMRYLLSGSESKVLGNQKKLEMFKQQYTMGQEFPGVGYVWFRFERNGHIALFHDGGTDNFSTLLLLFPDEKLGVFVSVNTMESYYHIIDEIQEILYGKDQKKVVHEGQRLSDMSGFYVNTRSGFENAEKVGSLGSTIHITGTPDKGFELNGEKLQPAGENYYQNEKLGHIKYFEKNGKSFVVIEGTPFVQVPWNQSTEWQALVLLLFIGLSLVGFIVSLILFIRSIKRRHMTLTYSYLPFLMMFVLLVFIVIRIFIMLVGMNMAGVDEFISFLKIAAAAITALGLLGILSTIFVWTKKSHIFVKGVYSLWSISMILFITWLFQVNLLG